MYISTSLSASTLLRAHIRQDIALLFTAPKPSFLERFQKYSYITTALLAFFSFLPASGYAATTEEREFVVTAYYSPLPNQNFYLRGNYEAEKRLNGNGTHGASGQPVFTGMLAAPSSYMFGTRIDLDGLGVGIVADRGGAIVEAWERGQTYDRIDVWMGYGDRGLRRAMIWWKRKVTWRITLDATKKVLDFTDIDTGKIDFSRFGSVDPSQNGVLSSSALEMFADLGYTPDGRTTKEMIIDYQLDHSIISSETDDGAWVYGPRTKSSLSTVHAQYSALRDAELQKIEAEKTLLLSEKTAWEMNYAQASSRVVAFGTPKKWDTGTHVRELQKTLRTIGYFRGKDTGIMWGTTILALKSLQKANGLSATGSLDDATREIIAEILIEKWV